jgi:hypothetical protein
MTAAAVIPLEAGEVPAAFDQSHRLREAIAPPSALEVLRAARPSRELVKLLADESTKAATAGNVDDAIALLILGLCAREVSRE